ncbi:PREDICTED: uncharacterized protein LOC108563863 isoform X2 [Nicrophorus vespilloides]|uniref:Uncharacterized protein LOC108563863 isoform X2 n=1 Tax=Nicrophorus vespilloides TaxID=110193 RepID=A0ABM1MU98_NICVS|nr:PREDICTED: uncharacterized protein LOC108563863 isoform X2 [Nicrophorus vespilloides]
MKSSSFNLQVIGLFLLSLIPWPGPTVYKISCPRDNARIVRKIIQNKWLPVLQKYKVSLPLECPFHHQREIFGPQQAAKFKHRPSQWTCGLCGKSFFEEKFLDMHFDNRHREHINMAEDAVCLADYCDIMRCDVLLTQDPKTVYPETVNTDIEIWKEASGYTKALVAAGPRDVAKYTVKSVAQTLKNSKQEVEKKERCQQTEAPSDDGSTIEENSQNKSFNNLCGEDLVDSALPAADNRQQRIAELQKLKSNCKPEELIKLKTKCEILVRDCIAGLLIQLSLKDFKEVEEELNRAVCWYLTCDRYWEDSQSDIRSFPWGLLCMIIMVLSLGICLCYYIIWVLFETDDVSVTSASVTDRSTPSPAHLLRQEASTSSDGHQYTEDYYTSDKDNEYIYVTYPPDLKRRLLESCYNRTTRL